MAHYTMGSGLEAMRRDSASSFYHYNHLGTALALTRADEAVTDTYRHDAWGVLLERTGSTLNPHTYVGRERYYRMPNAAMYHLGFRDYAQGLGRFTTVDPLQHGLLAEELLITTEASERRYDERERARRLARSRMLLAPAPPEGPGEEPISSTRYAWGTPSSVGIRGVAYIYALSRPTTMIDARGLQPQATANDKPRMLPWPLVCGQAAKWHSECIEKLQPLREKYPCNTQKRWEEAMKNIPECRWAMEAWARCGFGSYPKTPKARP